MPGPNTQYLLPRERLTLMDEKVYMTAARDAGVAKALSHSIAPGPDQLDVRQPQNILDFACPLDQWNTAALAVVGNQYSCFQNQPNPTLANNRVLVFYGVCIETVPCPVSLLTFRSGTLTGIPVAVFDLEPLFTCELLMGFFTQPVVFGPGRMFAAQVTARIATGLLARVQLLGFTIEPKGITMARDAA